MRARSKKKLKIVGRVRGGMAAKTGLKAGKAEGGDRAEGGDKK